jgi:hypothetical protein
MYKFLILNTYHTNALYLRQQGCEDPWLSFEAERVPRAKDFGKTWIRRQLSVLVVSDLALGTDNDFLSIFLNIHRSSVLVL